VKKLPVIHPFLMALFPILFLLARNVATVPLSQSLPPSAILLGFAFVGTSLLRMLLGDGRKAGMIVSVFLILGFSYGHVFEPVARLAHSQFGVVLRQEHLLLACAAIFALYVYMAIRTESSEIWTMILNVMAISLVAVSAARIGAYEVRVGVTHRASRLRPAEPVEINPGSEGNEDLPDIYYIILDRYASSSTLQQYFHFDNGDFTDHLASQGFYVASEARANYPKTFESLASSLNMSHLTYLSDELGSDASDKSVVYEMIEDYEVWRFLKSRGYTFYHFGSWWEPTRHNRHADVSFTVPLTEFWMLLYRTSILHPIGTRLGILDPREMRQQTVLRKFDRLADVPGAKGPKFVFVHMLLPHNPYVFGPNGEMLAYEQVKARTEIENYLNQLAFTNEKMTWVIDEILSKSERPPIIVVQADEGPCGFLEEFGGTCGDSIDWTELSEEALRVHMRIFSAYYLPGVDYEAVLYPSVTPVNSFRIIFHHYFGANYSLLDDTSYIFKDMEHPYSFFDVTDAVKYP